MTPAAASFPGAGRRPDQRSAASAGVVNCQVSYGACAFGPGSRNGGGWGGARAAGVGCLAGFDEILGYLSEFAVQMLRGPAQDIEGLAGGNALAFHEDSLGLADHLAGAQ